MKIRLYSAMATLALLFLIDTNLNPGLWQVGLVTLMTYEGFRAFFRDLARRAPIDGEWHSIKEWWEEKIG